MQRSDMCVWLIAALLFGFALWAGSREHASVLPGRSGQGYGAMLVGNCNTVSRAYNWDCSDLEKELCSICDTSQSD